MDHPLFLVVVAAAGIFSLRSFYALSCRIGAAAPDNIPTEKFSRADAVFAATLVFFFLVMIWSSMGQTGQITSGMVLRGALLWVLLITSILAFLILRGISPLEAFGLRRQGLPAALLQGVGWLALGYPLILLAQALSYFLVGDTASPQDIVQFLAQSSGWRDLGAVIVLAVVVAPVAEELIFRGYLYGVLRKYSGRFWAVIISSFLFAGIHGHLPSFAGLLLFGAILALIYERTSNLWVPVAVHALFNGITISIAIFWPSILE
jgi:uncharacterized protein